MLDLYALIILLHAEFIGRVWNGVPLMVVPMLLYVLEFARKRTLVRTLFDLTFPLSLSFLFFLTRIVLRYFDMGEIDTSYILIFAQICFISICSYGVFVTRGVTPMQAMRAFRNVIAVSYAISLWLMLMGQAVNDRFWDFKLLFVDRDDFVKSNPSYLFNAIGLTLRQHSFSYQVLLFAMVSAALIKESRRPRLADVAIFGLSIAALITTRERSSFVAFTVFVVALVIWNVSGRINVRKLSMLGLLALTLLVAGKWVQATLNGVNLFAIYERFQNFDLSNESRFQAAGYAFLAPLSEPWGNGELAESYIKSAGMIGFVQTGTGDVIGSHNHFANSIMYVGFIGYFIVLAYFAYAMLSIVNMRRKRRNYLDVLVLLFVGMTLNSMVHNAGFFTAEMCTMFVLMAMIYQNKRGVERKA